MQVQSLAIRVLIIAVRAPIVAMMVLVIAGSAVGSISFTPRCSPHSQVRPYSHTQICRVHWHAALRRVAPDVGGDSDTTDGTRRLLDFPDEDGRGG